MLGDGLVVAGTIGAAGVAASVCLTGAGHSLGSISLEVGAAVVIRCNSCLQGNRNGDPALPGEACRNVVGSDRGVEW